MASGVTHPRCAVPVVVALRQALIDLSNSRVVQEGQQTKMEQIYHYLTGTKFRQRVEAVVEKFNDMREDLDKERKFMVRQWAKREATSVPWLIPRQEWSVIYRVLLAKLCLKSKPRFAAARGPARGRTQDRVTALEHAPVQCLVAGRLAPAQDYDSRALATG